MKKREDWQPSHRTVCLRKSLIDTELVFGVVTIADDAGFDGGKMPWNDDGGRRRERRRRRSLILLAARWNSTLKMQETHPLP